MNKPLIIAAIAAILLGCAGLAAAQSPQAKPAVDMKKIMAEIAGEYDFDLQGQAVTITFYVQDGKLLGAPTGESAEDVVPVAGANPLKFEVNVTSGGQHFDLEFLRNDKGAIDKCHLVSLTDADGGNRAVDTVGVKKIK